MSGEFELPGDELAAPAATPTPAQPVEQESPAGSACADLMTAIEHQKQALEQGFDSLRAAATQLQTSIAEAEQAAQEAAQAAAEPVESMLPPAVAEVPVAQPVPAAAPVAPVVPQAAAVPQPVAAGGAEGGWDQVILGFELAQNPLAATDCQQLLGELRQGDAGAIGLVGNLLVFRSAEAEKLPKLLKEVGEAFYRWRQFPSGQDTFLQALIDWLHRVCEVAGIQNKIRLVQPGDRFDSTRHSAKERGIEIADVFGWIVLRDNGKVYSKANVSVK